MDERKSKVYVQLDPRGRIVRCEGGYTTPDDLTDWVFIDEGNGDRYNLCQAHYFVDGLYTQDGIPLYKWDGEQVVPRTEEEIAADRAAIPEPPPSEQERMEAQVTYTAMMTDTLLEV